MPPSMWGDCDGTQPSRGTARAGERGNVGARESKVPGGGPDLRLRSSSGSGGSKFLLPGGREWPQQAPGGRDRPTSGHGGNQFSQRIIRHGKRRPALFAVAVNNQDCFGREKFGAGIEPFWRSQASMIQTRSLRNSGSSCCNPTSLHWVKNAAPCAWG